MKTKLFAVLVLIVAMLLPSLPAQAASLYVTKQNITLAEGGGPLRFQLRLTASPSPNTISISFSTNGQCLIGYEAQNYGFGGQTITKSDIIEFAVKAIDDGILEDTQNCKISYSTTSSIGGFNNLSLSQSFLISENGNDSVPTTPALYTTVIGPSSINEGSSNIYTFGIGPSTAPTDRLTISAATQDGQCQLVSGGNKTDYLEFTIPAGVKGAAIFSVQATDDAVVEGEHSCTVNHSLRTNDTTYSGITAGNTNVPIIDDEAPFDSNAVSDEDLVGRKSFGLLDSTDANNDGIEDEKQPNVSNFINGITGRRQALIADGADGSCNAISNPDTKAEGDFTEQDSVRHFPHGLLDFRVICGEPGAEATITYLLDDMYNTDDAELVKFDRETGYNAIEDAKFSQEEVQNGTVTKIRYKLVDGGELDADGEANGIIVDPVGIAVLSTAPGESTLDNINDISENSHDNQPWVIIGGSVVLLILGAVGVFFGLKKRRAKKAQNLHATPVVDKLEADKPNTKNEQNKTTSSD